MNLELINDNIRGNEESYRPHYKDIINQFHKDVEIMVIKKRQDVINNIDLLKYILEDYQDIHDVDTLNKGAYVYVYVEFKKNWSKVNENFDPLLDIHSSQRVRRMTFYGLFYTLIDEFEFENLVNKKHIFDSLKPELMRRYVDVNRRAV